MNSDTERLLRQAAQKSGEWVKKRDDLIRRADSEGASLREIAAVVGLTHTGVKRVIERG